MVPMGFELRFSPAELAVLWAILVALALCVALPAAGALAAVGSARARRDGRPEFRNGAWYWLWGSALTIVSMYGLFLLGLSWAAIPTGWLPALLLAWLLRVRRSGPPSELRWGESRRPVGE